MWRWEVILVAFPMCNESHRSEDRHGEAIERALRLCHRWIGRAPSRTPKATAGLGMPIRFGANGACSHGGKWKDWS